MSWVKQALTELKENHIAKIRPIGNSMKGRIESGQLVTIIPSYFEEIVENDIVFIRWKGNYLLHLVKKKSDNEILIGNNLGKINGWVTCESILGKVINVEN